MVDVKGCDSATIPASSYVAGIKAVRRKKPAICPLTLAMPNESSTARLHWLATSRRLLWSLVLSLDHSVTVSLAKRCMADADQLAPPCVDESQRAVAETGSFLCLPISAAPDRPGLRNV